MRSAVLPFLLLLGLSSTAQPVFQLAPPLLRYSSGFFSDTTSFEIAFNQPGAELRYTLNGKEPALNDKQYNGPLTISARTVVKVKAFSPDYLASETVTASFIPEGKKISRIDFSKPNEYYAHAKPDILHDNIGGIANYRSGGWLGYDGDSVTIEISLGKKEKVSTVLVNLLQDENSWIFLPEQIRLYYFDERQGKYRLAGQETFSHQNPGPKLCNTREIKLPSMVQTRKLKLELFPLKEIPGWHNGKGKHGWLFIDEIKVF
jgi:hypothetical protein